MSDGIDIVIKDKIDVAVAGKLKEIGAKAAEASNSVKLLKDNLNVKGGSRAFTSIASAFEKLGKGATAALAPLDMLQYNLDEMSQNLPRAITSIDTLTGAFQRLALATRQVGKLASFTGFGNAAAKVAPSVEALGKAFASLEVPLKNALPDLLALNGSFNSLLLTTRSLTTAIRQLTSNLARMNQKTSSKAVQTMGQAATKVTTAVNQANAAVGKLNNIATKANNALKGTGNAAQQAAAKMGFFARAMQNVGTVAGFAATKVGGMRHAFRLGTNELSHFQTGVRSTGQAIRALVSGILLAGTAIGTLKGLDSFNDLQNKIRLAANSYDDKGILKTAESQERLNELTNQLYDIAQRTAVPVNDLATSYRRFDTAFAAVGRGQGESLRMTETLAKATKLSGANATEASSAFLQLSQAFNKGKLDGDEFRTTAENLPMIIDAVTKVLGKNRSEIYKLSETGQISIQVLIEAFQLLQEQVDRDFSTRIRTMGDAFTQLINAAIMYLGELDKTYGITLKVNSALDLLRENLPTVAKGFKALGAAISVIAFGALLSYMFSFVSLITTLIGSMAALVAFFVYFSDQIKVTKDGVVNLEDGVRGLIAVIDEASDLDMTSLFSPSGAQTAWNVLAKTIDFVIQKTMYLRATFDAVVKTASELLKEGEISKVVTDGFNYAVGFIKNLFIDFWQWFADVSSRAMTAVGNTLVQTFTSAIQGIAPLLGALKFVPFTSDETKAEIDSIITRVQAFKAEAIEPIDFGFSDALESFRVDLDKTTPNIEKLSKFFSDTFEGSLKIQRLSYQQFLNEVEKEARKAAEERKKIEDDIAKSRMSNPDALRQNDALLQELERLRLKTTQLQTSAQGAKSAMDQLFIDNSALSDNQLQKMGYQRSAQASQQQASQRQALGFGDIAPAAQQALPAVTQLNSALQATQFAIQSMAVAGQQPIPFISEASAIAIQSTNQGVTTLNSNLSMLAPSAMQAQTAFTGIGTSMQTITTSAQPVVTSVGTITESFNQAGTSSGEFANGANQQLQDVGSTATQVAQTISSSFSSASNTAEQAVASFASSAISNFNAIASAANDAANATSRVGSGGGGGGILGGLFGFSKGGYTGNAPRSSVAGFVHGQEFVMPADATARYRPILEAMRAGKSIGVGGGAGTGLKSGGAVNVTVQNYGSSKIEVEQISPTDIRIIAREEAARAVQSQAPQLMAKQLTNPNSMVSKSLAANTSATRRR